MWKKFFLDLFFPQFCLGCGREGFFFCEDCQSLIEVLEYQYCPFCQKPVRVLEAGKCPRHRRMNLDGLFAATSYGDKLVKTLVRKFKYEPFQRELRYPLTSLIITHFLSSGKAMIFNKPQNSFLIPIPLSASKKRERGFNQSEEIAGELSLALKIPLELNCLKKIKKTQPQVNLSLKERKVNIQNAFAVANPGLLSGKIIFLVDDVFTTGSTMEEASKVLKEAGAKKVWGIVASRELLED